MSNFFGSIWWLLVTLGLLVTFHEFGHFWVARRFGIKVLRFSVGFGKPLWSRYGKDGTEYCIAAIPLGGYVKFLDSREVDIHPDERDGDFTSKPIWQRMCVVVAGPLFNLIFTLFAFWAMFVVGKPDYQPVIGRVAGIAEVAGFQPGDRINSIGGEKTDNWTGAMMSLVVHVMDRSKVAVDVTTAAGGHEVRQLDLSKIAAEKAETEALSEIGLTPRQFMPGVPEAGQVMANSAAAAAGVAVGDRLLRLDGKVIERWDDLVNAVQANSAPGKALALDVERNGKPLTLQVTPRQEKGEDGKLRWMMGVAPKYTQPPFDAVLSYGPLAAIPAAVNETAAWTARTFGLIKRMFTGAASLQNLSGPVTIAMVANESAKGGVANFLSFLALISLSLCIMNLLPIPILDGGHLVYYLIESIKGSPLSEKALIAGQYAGLLMLAALMGLAFYNDIVHRILS